MTKSTSRERKALIVVLALLVVVCLVLAFVPKRPTPTEADAVAPVGLHVVDTLKPASALKPHRPVRRNNGVKKQSRPLPKPDSPLHHPVDRDSR